MTSSFALAADWHTANQRYLMEAVGRVRLMLEAQRKGRVEIPSAAAPVAESWEVTTGPMAQPPALETLAQLFSLSEFERLVLVLCAGVELDSRVAQACAELHGDPRRGQATFGLALTALPGAHWSALTPSGPLRYWRLLELRNGDSLTTSALRIDERILHDLTGASHLDERLAGLLERISGELELVPSHRAIANKLVACWRQPGTGGSRPVVQLCGPESSGKCAVVAAVGAELGFQPWALSAAFLPTNQSEVEALARLWNRETLLGRNLLLLDCQDVETLDAPHESAASRLVQLIRGPLIVASRTRRPQRDREVLLWDVARPWAAEQAELWREALGAMGFEEVVAPLVAQFDLSAPGIRSACAEARAQMGERRLLPDELRWTVWDACRSQARTELDGLAQLIRPMAGWQDLILPEGQRQLLREIVIQIRQRTRVYDEWGFAAVGSRGLGISALFHGASGTGKTLAAEVLANEMRLDLYRIDLSQVVSKYIGETEKNLRRVFDAAESSGALLLFGEADALFGKRSEVKDSHDRYAHIEISYLLQRMECYRGMAILTTNLKEALDPAFLRRIRFLVEFPFPDAAQREAIWARIFPQDTLTEGLRFDVLARLSVAGGSIRNIAINAAFLAAETGSPVWMQHLLQAARSECVKLQKPLTEAEIGGWV